MSVIDHKAGMSAVSKTSPNDEGQASVADRLDSWKEIAEYLKRSVRTVRRWEAEEGLPVHRHLHQNSGSVYAFRVELDAWLLSREGQPALESASSEPGSSAELPAGEPQLSSAGRLRRHILIGGAIAVAVWITYIGVVQFRSVAHANTGIIRSLAVLPLANVSGDPALAYLADGTTDALINELGHSTGVRVISRTSVIPYRGQHKALPVIARELNVDGIVEGAVARSGPRVRITVQLTDMRASRVDARGSREIWGRSYERDLNDLAGLRRDISAGIAAAVGEKPDVQPATERGTSRRINAESYRLFFQSAQVAAAQSSAGFTDGIAYLRQAIALQPDFAEAFARMALFQLQFAFNGMMAPRLYLPEAESAARKALELDDTLAEGHGVLGLVLKQQWDFSGAEKEFRRALALNPSDVAVHRRLSDLLSETGRLKEAVTEAELIRELDPRSSHQPLGLAYRAAGQLDRAIAEFRTAVEQDPHLPRLHHQLGQTYIQKGLLTEGVAELEAAVRVAPGNRIFRSCLAYAYALAGRRTEARKILEDFIALARREYVPPTAIARIYVGLEDTEAALDWLENAYREHDNDLFGIITETGLSSLRSDPRYQAIRARVGLRQ